ncbi:MAG TPA: SurA N-terminal domain-containing protein, partial [Alphaproteobacteria bacterium]|nr:SurA N-terminal domain-containing protein [Alphaproteobacteria bacterium]
MRLPIPKSTVVSETMTGRVPILIFALAAALWAGLGPLPQPVLAQGVQRIVAIVNDEVISGYDVEQRMRLILSTTQIQPTPEQMRRLQSQITEGLIDEAIQLQEAARLNIRIADEEIEQAVRYIEDQNGLAEGALALVLQGVNTDIETLYSQIRAQIAWSKVVSRRLRPTVFVGQDEIDAVLERMEAAEGLTEYLISEIFLSVDVPGRRTEIARDAANIVAEARRGTPFDALARQM